MTSETGASLLLILHLFSWQDAAFKAVEMVQQGQWQYSCYKIWCFSYPFFTVQKTEMSSLMLVWALHVRHRNLRSGRIRVWGVHEYFCVCLFKAVRTFLRMELDLKGPIAFHSGGGGGGGSGVRTKIYNENYCHLCFSRGLDPDLRSPVSSPCPKTDSV